MSQLRTAKAVDVGAFPGSTFVVDDTPPIAQCQETQIDEIDASVVDGQFTVTKIGAFVGIDLAGKTITVGNLGPGSGTFNIISNTDDVVLTDNLFGFTSDLATLTCQDPGQAYLTRNEPSFRRFTENAGKAHTTKGGQLYVDVAAGPMVGACSDTFNPQ